MQCSPQELKEKLLKHLDNDYNVVDFQGVFDVMAILERYPITKEHLEQTRIGKYVNEMRRRTVDRNLARRAKDLVRKWQQLVARQSSPCPSVASVAGPSTPFTGEISRASSSGSLVDLSCHLQATHNVYLPMNRASDGPYIRFPTNDDVAAEKELAGFCISEVSVLQSPPNKEKMDSLAGQSVVRSEPRTPVTVASCKSRPATPCSFCPNTPSPQMTTSSANDAAAVLIDSSKQFPIYSHIITNGTEPVTTADAAGLSSRLKLSGSTDALFDTKCSHTNGLNGMLKSSLSSTNLACNGIWSVRCDTNMNSDTVASASDLVQADAPLGKLKIRINRTSATGSVSSPVASSLPAVSPASAVRKTQKVATTAELIQRLHANGELRLVASETLNRIATNQIEHEIDDSNISIVPEGAKPRPHKKRRTERLPDQLPPAMTDRDLLQVKAERVRNFVQMSADVSSTAGDLLDLVGRLPVPTSVTLNTDVHCLEPELVPTDQLSTVLELPNLADFEIDWDSNTYTMPDVRPPVTDADVDRLLSEQWPSVNGQYDHHGEWTDWSQSYSAANYDGSLIHILPYVDSND